MATLPLVTIFVSLASITIQATFNGVMFRAKSPIASVQAPSTTLSGATVNVSTVVQCAICCQTWPPCLAFNIQPIQGTDSWSDYLACGMITELGRGALFEMDCSSICQRQLSSSAASNCSCPGPNSSTGSSSTSAYPKMSPMTSTAPAPTTTNQVPASTITPSTSATNTPPSAPATMSSSTTSFTTGQPAPSPTSLTPAPPSMTTPPTPAPPSTTPNQVPSSTVAPTTSSTNSQTSASATMSSPTTSVTTRQPPPPPPPTSSTTPSTTSTIPPPPPPPPPSSSQSQFGQKLLINSFTNNYNNVRNGCINMNKNATEVIISSQSQQDAVSNLIGSQGTPNTRYWIGVVKLYNNPTLTYYDGTGPITYQPWSTAINTSCLRAYLAYSTPGQWSCEYDQNAQYPAICIQGSN